MKTAIAVGISGLLAASASVALGAALSLTSTRVGAAAVPVPHCDPNGFTYSFTTSRGNVTAVTVGDIADPACEGGMLKLTVTDAGGGALAVAGPTAVPSDGDTLPNAFTLATSLQPAATAVAGIHVSVEGP